MQASIVKFSEIAARVNRVSTPIVGVLLDPPTVDVAVARRVVAAVESRRVLSSTYANEVPQEGVESVLQQVEDPSAQQLTAAGTARPFR